MFGTCLEWRSGGVVEVMKTLGYGEDYRPRYSLG